MTSSCGGKGPYDAATWASRKGFDEVADSIRISGGLRTFAANTYRAEHNPTRQTVMTALDSFKQLMHNAAGTHAGKVLLEALAEEMEERNLGPE